MTSREREDLHVKLFNKLLDDSGIECVRVGPESEESSVSEEEVKESEHEQEEETTTTVATPEEEKLSAQSEEILETSPEIFPTPSLRRVISDRERKIEAQNRIHVLPEEFKKYIDPQAIPKIASTAQQCYIEIIADLVGCTMYKSSLAEYWFLDTLANLLRRAQEDLLDRRTDVIYPDDISAFSVSGMDWTSTTATQAILMLWFCEWMKEIQHFDVADRQRMLKRFEDNMLTAARFISEENYIPTPAEAGVYYQENPSLTEPRSSVSAASKQPVTFEGASYECSLMDLMKIIHYIYDLFSTDYQYDLIRSVFTQTPDHILIDAPYQIQNPKNLYAPLKAKTKKDMAKKDSAKKDSAKKATPQKRGKKEAVETEEYLRLMELKAREERYLDEQEEVEKEVWNRKSHILPLSFAVNDEFLDKYWPPPPPPSDHELLKVEPEPKGKGKQKAKK